MTIRATSGNLANVYSMYNEMLNKSGTSSGQGTKGAAASSGLEANAGAGRTSGLLTPEGREQLSVALKNMRKAGWDSFTWDDIEKYRKSLEADFTKAIKSDLAKMGADPDIQFTLVVDAYGQTKVVSDSPDKFMVEQYLEDNPKMVDTFKHIQALSNLKRSQQKGVAQNSEFTKNLKATLQAEAVQAFFAATDNNGKDYFSQIANFGSDTNSWYLGLNQKV